MILALRQLKWFSWADVKLFSNTNALNLLISLKNNVKKPELKHDFYNASAREGTQKQPISYKIKRCGEGIMVPANQLKC